MLIRRGSRCTHERGFLSHCSDGLRHIVSSSWLVDNVRSSVMAAVQGGCLAEQRSSLCCSPLAPLWHNSKRRLPLSSEPRRADRAVLKRARCWRSEVRFPCTLVNLVPDFSSSWHTSTHAAEMCTASTHLPLPVSLRVLLLHVDRSRGLSLRQWE